MSLDKFDRGQKAWYSKAISQQMQLDKLELKRAVGRLEKLHIQSGFSQPRVYSASHFTFRRRSFNIYINRDRALKDTSQQRILPPKGVEPHLTGVPLSPVNMYYLQDGKQCPYSVFINGIWLNLLVQRFPFCQKHLTIPTAYPEPQGWRPEPEVLRRRIMTMVKLAESLESLVILNGVGAGAGITNWFHFQAMLPDDMPVVEAINAAPKREGAVRIPNWPLTAFVIRGSADTIADEVVRLSQRCTELGGEHATESIAIVPYDGSYCANFVPRDSRREFVDAFGAKLGSFEVCLGSLVASAEKICTRIEKGTFSGEDLWKILAAANPEWADAIF